jgi:UDP:flavonoid glycosyltransferase YjiC (YdhE family)
VKIVCSFVGGAGHLVPQLPLLQALAEAGHQLTIVGRESALSSAPAGLFVDAAALPDRHTATSAEIAPLC